MLQSKPALKVDVGPEVRLRNIRLLTARSGPRRWLVNSLSKGLIQGRVNSVYSKGHGTRVEFNTSRSKSGKGGLVGDFLALQKLFLRLRSVWGHRTVCKSR